ncbi:MAG: NAD-dependent epimerase/dehydratase family protein [Spirochaetales bacterium]|nr:NAD-dependent epimerase/dehydratase family protein [Spirochaetales bacterium]
MKVLVTGADGMLGSHICRELIKQDYSVRVIIQKERSTGTLDGLKIDKIYGDILDYDILLEGLSECDAIINVAASTQVWPSRSKQTWAINFEAVKLLAKAAISLRIEKFIHIGTATSFSPGSKADPGIESNKYTDFKFKLDYQDSKYAAQKYLLDLHKSENLPVCIVNPSFMFGAFDSKPGAGQMIVSIHKGKVPGYTKGGKSYIAAKDVSVVVVNALEKGSNGECYLASGENLNYQEAFNLIAEVINAKPPNKYTPSLFVNIFGFLGSVFGTVFKLEPKLSLPMARISNADCYYSNKKAIQELDLPQTPLREAVEECFNWLKENGHLKDSRDKV